MTFFTAAKISNSFWFSISQNDTLIPNRPILLAILNAPLDTLTLLISIALLKFVISKGRYFVIIAFVDIIISCVLAVFLHSILKLIEIGNFNNYLNYLSESFYWMKTIISNFPNPNKLINRVDWPLIPLVLTPFIPVSIYMTIFIFFGVILKPFTKITSYILGLLWEQNKTPFFLLGFSLSMIVISVKALVEWKWFVEIISKLIN